MAALVKVRMKDGRLVGVDTLRAAQIVAEGNGSYLDETETATAPKGEVPAAEKRRGGKAKDKE